MSSLSINDNRQKKIVTIGGGTGHFAVLSGLKKFEVDLKAIVTMSDSGGSSGRLRDELGVLPPGDLRQCLVALTPEDGTYCLLRRLFNYRFKKGNGLKGHNLGNLLLAALEDICGNPIEAIEEASRMLNIRGEVIPASLSDSHLHALLSDGTKLCTEHEIDTREWSNGVSIQQVFLKPAGVAYARTVESILEADMVVVGPGDLYTSILANLVVKGIGEALKSTKAKRVLVSNLMTKRSETDGFRLSHFVREIYKYIGQNSLDYIITNEVRPPEALVSLYLNNGSTPVIVDREETKLFGAQIVERSLLSEGNLIRHDPDNLASALMDILDGKL